MLRIVEKSTNCLRLSDAIPFWEKWRFLGIILIALLSGIFIFGWVIQPAWWSGAGICTFILLFLIREIPENFDREVWFDRKGDRLIMITRPWVGKPKREYYPFSDITAVQILEEVKRHSYPGHDFDDAENEAPIESSKYDVGLSLRSGKTLLVMWENEKSMAASYAKTMAEFLGISFTGS